MALAALAITLMRSGSWPPALAQVESTATATFSPSAADPTATLTPSLTPTEAPSPTPLPPEPRLLASLPPDPDLILLSMDEGGYSRLFAYQPLSRPLTRLTDGPWNDLTPALSPDGTRVAFASDRDGHWQLYLLDLSSGETIRLTASPEYKAAPSWSPDGLHLAYETYLNDNLEVAVLSLGVDQPPIPLSDHPAADYSPAWSPHGRQIAFVSTRSGEPEVWLADLDLAGEQRFTNLSQSPLSAEAHPAWSPGGDALAWSSREGGVAGLYVWRPGAGPVYVGSGDRPAWSPSGDTLLTTLAGPNQTWLTAYQAGTGLLALPPLALPGAVSGLTWGAADLPSPRPPTMAQAAGLTPTPLWQPALLPAADDLPAGRQRLVALDGVQAPYPLLHDLVDESFQALRARVAAAAGWDLLASLENAYLPLTAPLAPGLGDDWLYTGRAFTFTPLPLNAGWLVVTPEEFGAQTYWRVYLRALRPDGSQGRPLQQQPWDLNARYNGAPPTYEQGGQLSGQVPPGYWVDLTALAAAYGWERLPALPTWRSSFPAARFNYFVFSGGQDWRSAMLELYPPEALVTPTLVVPPTLTPTPTPRWYRTPTPTLTPTPRPTLTPLPGTPTPAP